MRTCKEFRYRPRGLNAYIDVVLLTLGNEMNGWTRSIDKGFALINIIDEDDKVTI